jgi:putative PIN family toxin of toxin-antitoxin system
MAPDPWRVFLDTNVLISGVLSRTGASAAILDLGEAEEIVIVVSEQVLVEADRTFLVKFSHLIERYRTFIKNLAPLLLEDPSRAAVKEAATAIDPDDASILAAAKQGRVDFLVTLDTRHFLTSSVRAYFAAPIVTPSEFLTAFRGFWETPK